MGEALPILLGFLLGGVSTRFTGRPLRAVRTVGTVACVALFAVFSSGEFHRSWIYVLLDLLEAAAGFAAGCAVVRYYRFSVAHK